MDNPNQNIGHEPREIDQVKKGDGEHGEDKDKVVDTLPEIIAPGMIADFADTGEFNYKSKPNVEVFTGDDREQQNSLMEQIKGLPSMADEQILTNALFGFGLGPGGIKNPIFVDYKKTAEEKDMIAKEIGANLNNSLITIEQMLAETEQGKNIFENPQYIRLQIHGETSDTPKIVYVPIKDEAHLKRMAERLEEQLKILNTSDRTWTLDENYRNNYKDVPINPELVSIMDQSALEAEMSGISQRVEGSLPNESPDYTQPLEWEPSDKELDRVNFGHDLAYVFKELGRTGSTNQLLMRHETDLREAILAIRGNLKFIEEDGWTGILPGGVLYRERLERELARLRRLHELGQPVEVKTKKGYVYTEMRIPGTDDMMEQMGYERLSPEGAEIHEIVNELVVYLPKNQAELINYIKDNNLSGAAIEILSEFLKRDGLSGEDIDKIKALIHDFNRDNT